MTVSPGRTGDCCFLCGEILTPQTRSDEHFIPKWIPRAATERFGIAMANQSVSQARHLVVPCCIDCNGAFAKVEDQLARALRSGPEDARSSAWAAKVTWGFACLESRLPRDRTRPHGPRILTFDEALMLSSMREIAYDWLRGSSDRRGSLHAFHAQHEAGDDIGFADDPPAGLVALRLGRTAIIVTATDHQDAEKLSRDELVSLGYMPVFTDLGGLPLGPIQFLELVAWTSTLHRSRAPLPEAGSPFGAFDEQLYRERLEATVGQLPTYRITGIPWHTTLFNPDLTPRLVPISQSRDWGKKIMDGTAD